MSKLLKEIHFASNGSRLEFENQEGLYPVNRYQSLLLATAVESVAYQTATEMARPLSELAAWEVCCGGGAAAISLKEIGVGWVQATDLQGAMLDACRKNASRNQIQLDRLIEANLLNDFSDKKYDLIVANPPCAIQPVVSPEDTQEVQTAVGGGKRGIDATLKLIQTAKERLTDGGSLVFALVSTSDFLSVFKELSAVFGKNWQSLPMTPVASAYGQIENEVVRKHAEGCFGFQPILWERADRRFWRLSWVIQVKHVVEETDSVFEPTVSLCPFGWGSSEEGLNSVIAGFSRDGKTIDNRIFE